MAGTHHFRYTIRYTNTWIKQKIIHLRSTRQHHNILHPERLRNGVTRITGVFTPLNDVEHSFAQALHLKEVFPELAPEVIDEVIADVTARKRDDLVYAAWVARE